MGKTSSAVKNRYNNRVYRRVSLALSRQLVDEWEAALESDNISKTEFIRSAIVSYLREKDKNQQA